MRIEKYRIIFEFVMFLKLNRTVCAFWSLLVIPKGSTLSFCLVFIRQPHMGITNLRAKFIKKFVIVCVIAMKNVEWLWNLLFFSINKWHFWMLFLHLLRCSLNIEFIEWRFECHFDNGNIRRTFSYEHAGRKTDYEMKNDGAWWLTLIRVYHTFWFEGFTFNWTHHPNKIRVNTR